MTVSIGIATTDVRPYAHYGEAPEILRLASALRRSSSCIDRRGLPPRRPG